MRCRADVLAQLVALLDGDTPEGRGECGNPAVFSVAIVRAGEGFVVEMWAEVCSNHEYVIQQRGDYSRSIRLRS